MTCLDLAPGELQEARNVGNELREGLDAHRPGSHYHHPVANRSNHRHVTPPVVVRFVARVALYMKRLATSEKNFATGAARLAHVPTVTSASQIGPIAAISHLRFSLGRFAFVASWVNDIPRVPG